MFKLFMFACMLALAVAAPKPGVFYSSPYTAYSSPVAYSAYSAYSAPLTYSAYAAAPVAYSSYRYDYTSPYAAYTYFK